MSDKMYALKQMQLICIAAGIIGSQIAWAIYAILLYTGKVKVWDWL